MPDQFQYDVFLSHNSEDKPRVRRLAERLRAAGLQVWFDEWVIQPGDDIYLAIERGLEVSRTLVLCLSPAALGSDWVGLERSTALFRDPANAGRRFIPLLLVECKLPDTLRRYKYVDCRQETQATFDQLLAGCRHQEQAEETPAMSAIERHAFNDIYHFNGGHASAIRMFGADDDFIPSSRLHIEYSHEPLQIQPDLKEAAARFVESRNATLHKQGVPFFDGPNTRLVKWKASPATGARSALEEKEVYLTLGPVGWFDYEGLNGKFRELVGPNPLLEVYEYYTGLSRILSHQDLSKCRLSNIVGTATTLITTDGFVAYARRGERVVRAGLRTSAVAENLNRYLDDADMDNPLSLFNPPTLELNTALRADSTYQPKGVPHPIAAVRRGLSEELSPEILRRVGNRLPLLTGICFDLVSAHPDLLFIYALPMTAAEIVDLCRKQPGKDYFEGRLNLLRADDQDTKTARTLQCSDWIPSGIASVLRALELLQALLNRSGASSERVFELLAGR